MKDSLTAALYAERASRVRPNRSARAPRRIQSEQVSTGASKVPPSLMPGAAVVGVAAAEVDGGLGEPIVLGTRPSTSSAAVPPTQQHKAETAQG